MSVECYHVGGVHKLSKCIKKGQMSIQCRRTVIVLMALASITASSANASIGDWFKAYALPSIANGNGQWVSCFFNEGSAYQDLTLRLRYNKIENYSELKFDNGKTQKLFIESITENRLFSKFYNSSKSFVKLRISFSDGSFQMTKGNYMTGGICEEEK